MGTLFVVCLGVVTVVHLAFGISAYFQVTAIDITSSVLDVYLFKFYSIVTVIINSSSILGRSI